VVVPPPSAAQELAYDMVDSSSLNLVDFTNFAPVFTSPGDAFGKLRVGVTPEIPATLLDETLNGTPGDGLGIVEAHVDLAEFFGICDTDNPDTGGAEVSAAWTFDISGGDAAELCVDLAAMGDFEASGDSLRFEVQVDGVLVATDVFPFSVEESASQAYTMADGTSITLDDPAAIAGTHLDDALRTWCTPVPDGDSLILTVLAATDGGSEGIVVRDIVVRGAPSDLLFADGFEAGTTGEWTLAAP
jgi:hypothetical protein